MNVSHLSHVLIEALSVAGVAAIVYASTTNFDNLVVLSAYAAKPGYRPLFVKLIFVLVCLTVLFVSIALARLADTLPTVEIRFLGVIPMGLGVYHLTKLIMGRFGGGNSGFDDSSGSIGLSGYIGFALALLANSSDSVIVLAPVLADLKFVFALTCFGAALAVAILMSSLAGLVSSNAVLRSRVEEISKWGLPFVLIGIGILIFTDNPSDVFIELGAAENAA